MASEQRPPRATGARAVLGRLGPWAVPALDALIEGAWIAVVDAAFAAVAQSAPLGPIPFAVAAGASLYLTRNAADRTTQLVGLAILYVGGFVIGGLIGGPFSGTAGPGGAPIPFAQAAAALMALAVFRGSRHSEVLDDDLVNGTLLQWGIPLLAIPWLFAAQLEAGDRDQFVATAFPATLVFAAAGLLALGLSRLDTLSALSGVNWRSNRAWLALILGVLGAMIVVAIPAAFLLGAPIVLLAAGLLGPLSFILGPIGFVFGKILEFIFLLLSPLLDFIQSLVAQRQNQPGQSVVIGTPPQPVDVQQGEPSLLGLIAIGAIVLAIGIGIFILILRLTYRPKAERDAEPEITFEEHEFRLPTLGFQRPRLRRQGATRSHPTTASGAYLAFLADLDAEPTLARRPDEPPATHAARLRASGFTDRRASLLAADYQLERYAERDLPARETRRALSRWTSLREVVRTFRRAREDAPTT